MFSSLILLKKKYRNDVKIKISHEKFIIYVHDMLKKEIEKMNQVI